MVLVEKFKGTCVYFFCTTLIKRKMVLKSRAVNNVNFRLVYMYARYGMVRPFPKIFGSLDLCPSSFRYMYMYMFFSFSLLRLCVCGGVGLV